MDHSNTCVPATATFVHEPQSEVLSNIHLPTTTAFSTTTAIAAGPDMATSTTTTTTITSQSTPSSPSLLPSHQPAGAKVHIHTQPTSSPSPMSPLQVNNTSSPTTCLLPLSTVLQTTTENAIFPLVNNSNNTTTTTSPDTSGTPASYTTSTTSNNNSSTPHTTTSTTSTTISNTDSASKTISTSNDNINKNNNSSSNNSSNVSRHASSPSSSTTASNKSATNMSQSVRKITTMTSGGKTLGFFGSLSPKSSKHKISNKADSTHPITPVPPSPQQTNTITPSTTLFPPNHISSHSHSPISSASFQPEGASTPTSQRLQSAISSNVSSPSGKQSMDLTDSPRLGLRFHQQQQQLQQEQHQQLYDTSKDKKRTKDKDRPHSHFGQRLSKAIGLSSSSSKNQQQQQRQQQRLRQLSVDSLSTIDAAPPPITAKASEAPQQQLHQAQRQTGKPTLEKEKEKEKRGGIMNHFLHRPRILSSNDGLKSKVLPHLSAGSATGGGGGGGGGGGMPSLSGNRINSFKTPDASFAQSTTNSDISQDSEAAHRRDSIGNGADGSGSATGEDSDTGALRKFQSRHRQDRGSSNSSKSLVDTLTVHNFRRRPSLIVDLMPLSSSSSQHHHLQLYQKVQSLPPSMADMVESTLEVHHPHHHPGDIERLDLYSHLGLQEMHYNTGTGEEPSEKMIRQLYGNAAALRKDHSSTSFLSSPSGFGTIDPRDHPRRASTPGVNLSEAHSSITSNASIFAATMASPGPLPKSTSTRFGKLGRFKFPSLSMGSIHRHKHGSATGSTSSIHSTSDDQQHHAMMLANFNNKRRSSLSIPFKSSMFSESTTLPVIVPPPPSPASHIHVSDSASTFASVNTVGMTTLGPSTIGSSSNHSSISSSYNAFELASSSAGKPRQPLSVFLEEQAHQPHHSSTSGMNGLPSTTGVASSSPHQQQQQQLQIQRPLLNKQDVVLPTEQQRNNGHPCQQSRSLGKSFIGPENFNANMPTSSSSGTSNGSSSGQQHHGISLSFRSGLLRRSSRRTVSASHISSKNIFDLDTASSSHQEAAAQAYQDLMGPQAQGGEDGDYGEAEGSSPISQFSERNMLSAALIEGLAAVDAIETHTGKPEGEAAGAEGAEGAEGLQSGKSTGSMVGQYLFGDDFKNLAFGERDSASLVKVDSAVDTTTAAADVAETGSRLKMAQATISQGMLVAAAAQPAILAKLTEPTSSSSITTKVKVDQDKALLSKLLGAKKKSDSFLPSSSDSALSTLSTRNSSSSLASTTATAIAPSSSPTHLYTTDSKAAPGPMIIPRDRKLTLGSKATSHNKQQQQETPTTPTPPAFIPRSPAAVAVSRKYPGDPGFSSPSPPSYNSSNSPISATPIPTPGATPTKSKFSILGPSATSGAGFSYLQNRPSLSLTMTSSSSTLSSSHHGLGSSSSSTSPYMPHHSSSVPLPGKSSHGSIGGGSTIPHLEPRSAVVDYRPAIHYKRQRSMSLQDADLLTADQFIALMPDDAPTKRRFSSEETLQDNSAWAMSVKAKNVPLPDPQTTLRTLHSTLKTKCDLVLKHLAAVSAPISPPPSMTTPTTSQQQQSHHQNYPDSPVPRNIAASTPSASLTSSSTFSSSALTLSTLSRSGSESLSSHLTTDLMTRKLAEESEASLAVSSSEQILIRIQGAKDLQLQHQHQQTVLAFKDVGAGGIVSVDDVRNRSYDGEHGSVPSATSATMPGGSRPKKSSLVVGGYSGVNPSNGCAAPSETSASSGQPLEPKQENETPPIDVDQIDVVEMVGILFDEMDQIMTRMVEMLAKYISTDQFSKLLKESDEICYQAQEVCRVELDRRCQKRQELRRSHQQQQQEQLQRQPQHAPHQDEEVEVEVVFERRVLMDQQAITVQHQPPPQTLPQKLEFSKEPIWAISTGPCGSDPPRDPPHPLSSVLHNHSPQEQSSVSVSVPTPTKPVAIPIPSSLAGSAEAAGDEDERHVKKKDSKDRIRHRRDRNHYKHQYRYHPQGGQGKKFGEAADPHGEIMSSEEHQGAVYDYIRAVLTMAEVSMAEYMRIYNRMLVVPTNGYRIEGCNDLKKVERSMRPDHPHIAPLSITKASTSGSSQPSLLSRISAVQNATTDMAALSPGSTILTATPAVDCGVPNPSGSTPSAHASVSTSVNSTAVGDTSDQALSPTKNDIFSPPNAASSSGGQAMVRVKSLPESKDEWAALQKRKEMGGSPGVAGAISMGTPAAVGITVSGGNAAVGIGGGIGGIGATGAGAAGVVTDTRIAMMGEYSTEHMGHEAYYYRNWFLGKEHRTFVGQVEGLGTVIISIIKDMVIPTEGTRLQLPSRSSTGPNSLTHLSSFVSLPSTGAGGGGSGSHSAGLTRPELVHSAQSFYPGRGTALHGSGVGGNGMLASPRTSSEAMRIILSASTAVASGAGSSSDTHGSGLSGVTSSPSGAGPTMGSSHLALSTPATPGLYSPNAPQPNYHSGSNNSSNSANTPPRWQYRCILRQKDVDSIRITLPEPEPGPLNNLTRRAGKPQWKTILQSIHPAITQQVASKLKKVQNNPHFEKELAKFDETMLRFNYKFGVLLVHPGQTKEEDWFSNQMSSSPRFQEFLESGALGQKVALKGFERFSAGLDTRSEGGEYSYYDTWGEGFEIMYHVSTLLPYNTVDRQQIQRKRHIGNDIVCIVFVDGDQPFVPNTIKSQFLHIFVIIHLIVLPDGNKAYSATVTCDEQVPEFGPPLPDPPIFKTPEELRAFLLCKMINGENAAYKAPRLIKPHQRARSGMLENLVAKANTLAKVKDIDKKLSKHQKTTATAAATTTAAVVTPTTSSTLSVGPTAQHTLLSMSSSPNLTPSYSNVGGGPYSQAQSPYCNAQHCQHQQNLYQHGCQYCAYDKDVHSCCSAASTAAPHASISSASLGEDYTHSNHQSAHLIYGRKGPIPAAIRTNNNSGSVRNSLVVLGTETAASLFKSRRRSSNADGTKVDAQFHTGIAAPKEKDVSGGSAGDREQQQQQQGQIPDQFPEGHGYIESLMSPTVPGMMPLPSPMLAPASLSVADIGPFFQQGDVNQCSGGRGSCCQNQNGNCCCYTPTCCSYSCCEESDCVVEIPQSRPTKQTPNGTVKYGAAHHPQYLQGVLKQPSKSAASSPTETQFAMNRLAGYAQGEHHSHYHTVTLMNGLDAAMLSAERKGFDTLGMSLTGNSKGRSKSEVDLLLTSNQEVHNSSPNRHSISGSAGLNEFHHHHHSHAEIIATTPHAHHYLHYHRGGSTGQQQQYSPVTPNGAIPIRTSSLATTGPVTHQTATAPAHSSMKGRAHNFLTTLVRRRASSNDTSGLGPTAHQIGVPKHSNLGAMASSPLGTWINTAGSHHHHQHQHQRQQNSHHALCCCQVHRQQHQHHHHPPQQRHSFNSLSPNPATSTPLAAAPQEGSTNASVPALGRPLKFKEGYSNKGKAAPMHINTAAAAAMGSSSATAAAASYQSQYHHQHSSHHGHLSHHNHNPSSASTPSSASSSSLYHSSIPSASTVKPAGSSYRAGSLGGSGTSMMLATPSSSSSSGFSPHSLRSFASKEAIHRSTSSPSQNQGLGRSTSGRSEELTPLLATADAGNGAAANSEGSSSVNKGEAVIKASSSPEAVQVTDATDGQEDGAIQFTESPLPYTPQGQLTAAQTLPTSSGPKPMEPRTSTDSLGGRPYESNSATVPTTFPPGIGNLNRSPMDYMSFKPANSSNSSSARNSLLQQQRYDPGYSAAARVRGQSGDVVRRRGQHLLDPDLDDDDDDDIGSGGNRNCARNSSEDLARFLSMGPLALRESHAVMILQHSSDQHQHQYQHQVYQHPQNLHHHHHHGHHDHSYGHAGHHNHHHHHYHHYHHAPSPPARQQYQYPREVRRPSSGSLPLRNESPSRFYHTATSALPVADTSKTTGHVNLPPVTPAITRTMSSSSTNSGKQVKRAVSVESFLGQETVLSRVPSLRSKGYGLEAALLSTMMTIGAPNGLASVNGSVEASCSLPSVHGCCGGPASGVVVVGPACEVILGDQDELEIQEKSPSASPSPSTTAAVAAHGISSATVQAKTPPPVTPAITKTRQESSLVQKSNESQHNCPIEFEELDVKPTDT